jgi:hypothetical protein
MKAARGFSAHRRSAYARLADDRRRSRRGTTQALHRPDGVPDEAGSIVKWSGAAGVRSIARESDQPLITKAP